MKRMLPLIALLAACKPSPINILEAKDAGSAAEEAGSVANDAEATGECTGNESIDNVPLCFLQCAGDAFNSAACVDHQWICPPGSHAESERNTFCVGKISGP